MADDSSRWRRVLSHPVTRLVLFLAAIAVAAILADVAVGILRRLLPMGDGLGVQALGVLLLVSAVHLAYTGMVRILERRRPREIVIAGMGPPLGTGLLIGGGLITAVAVALWALGVYEVVGTGSLAGATTMLLLSVAAGYVEEIVVRGVLFRILEEGLGTWIALALTATAFGALHLGNPNAGWMGTITIAATAGVLLAGVYVWTRSLWTAVGAHFAWNFTEGAIYGMPVSGLPRSGLVEARLEGPTLLTGGAFGPEASVVTLVIGVAAAAIVLRLAALQDRFIRPFWRR